MTEPLVDVTGRRRQRERAKRLRLLRRVAAVLGVLAVIGGLVWVVVASPVFTVQSVRVTRTSIVAEAQVLDAAAIPLGTPLGRIDDQGARDRVAALPAVERVRVDRVWPNAVAISVTERTVRLVVAREGGFDWVDAAGVTFHATPERPEGVLLGSAASGEPRLLAALVKVANALPPAVRSQATMITADSLDSITITLAQESRVIWGSSEDSDLKAAVIGPLLSVKASVYDVSSPSHPTTRAG